MKGKQPMMPGTSNSTSRPAPKNTRPMAKSVQTSGGLRGGAGMMPPKNSGKRGSTYCGGKM